MFFGWNLLFLKLVFLGSVSRLSYRFCISVFIQFLLLLLLLLLFFLVELILWGCCLKIFIHRLIHRMSMGHFLEFYSYRPCLHDFSWLNFFMIYKIMQVKHRNRDFLALNSCFLTLLVWESVASRGTKPDFGSVRCSRTPLIHGGVGGWSYHQRIWQHCHKLWD